MSIGPSLAYTSLGDTSSPATMNSRMAWLMLVGSSSRTTFASRRARSSCSTISSRSSASSASISMSALRVTRNIAHSITFIPGNSSSRFPAITCSSGTKFNLPGSGTQRGRFSGTLIRTQLGSVRPGAPASRPGSCSGSR